MILKRLTTTVRMSEKPRQYVCEPLSKDVREMWRCNPSGCFSDWFPVPCLWTPDQEKAGWEMLV